MNRKIVLIITASIIVGCSGGFKWNNPETTSYWRKYRGEFLPDSLTSFFPINNPSKAKSFESISIASVEKKKGVYKNRERALEFAKHSPFCPYMMREVYGNSDAK